MIDRGEPLSSEEVDARSRIDADPADDRAYRTLAGIRRAEGRIAEADALARDAVFASLRQIDVAQAIAALQDGRLAIAEGLIRQRIQRDDRDALAVLMLGDLAQRLGILDEAEAQFRRAVELSPSLDDGWLKLGHVLHERGRSEEALAAYDEAIERAEDPSPSLTAKILVLGDIGDYQAMLVLHERYLAIAPDEPGAEVRYGNTLKTVGNPGEAIAAYRRAIAIDPECAEAWWSLSNMKIDTLSDDDVILIESMVSDTTPCHRRLHLHFTLGKAYEDRKLFSRSFSHYAAGNADRRSLIPHDRLAIEQRIDESISLFDRPFFERRTGVGNSSDEPIFIVGMPRSGSTLVEQILASHSRVEGTSELPTIPAIGRQLLATQWRDPNARYPLLLGTLPRDEFARLGSQYLDIAARHRKTEKPMFIDKMPINWLHIGLIHLIFPKAVIIDVRREPMACCFANFKQHFARGQSHAYDLGDLGHQYRLYSRWMEHVDETLPGRVVRVNYEQLTANPDAEIGQLLQRVGLPFEEQCLRFHENRRPVRTPSAEQVRRPITRDAVDQWRHFEPWLAELKDALGPLVD